MSLTTDLKPTLSYCVKRISSWIIGVRGTFLSYHILVLGITLPLTLKLASFYKTDS